MVIGLPCISTDCRPGGAALLIENGKNGLLCPRGNPEELAKCMIWIAEQLEEADKMGEEAKRISDHFFEKRISKIWEEYFNSLK